MSQTLAMLENQLNDPNHHPELPLMVAGLRALRSRLSTMDTATAVFDLVEVVCPEKAGFCRCSQPPDPLFIWAHEHHGDYNRVVHELLVNAGMLSKMYREVATDLAVPGRVATWRSLITPAAAQRLLAFLRPDAERFGWFENP